MRSDLAQFESVSRLNLPGSSSSDDTDSIIQMGMSSRHSQAGKLNSNLNLTDITSKLKDELHRALLSEYSRHTHSLPSLQSCQRLPCGCVQSRLANDSYLDVILGFAYILYRKISSNQCLIIVVLYFYYCRLNYWKL